MTIQKRVPLTCREFDQDIDLAKPAAEEGPVFITDRRRPAHILLSIRDYLSLPRKQPRIGDLLTASRNAADFVPVDVEAFDPWQP